MDGFISQVAQYSSVTTTEDGDLLFVIEHEHDLESEYPGHYVAIHRGKVIASGLSVSEVYAEADRQGIPDPLITYVPGPGEELLLVWSRSRI